MSINFTATHKLTTAIPKYSNNEYKPEIVSVVELDKHNPNDKISLYATAVDWTQKGAEFAFNIFHETEKPTVFADLCAEHFYALTTQKDDFEHLDYNKTLGLMMFGESNLDNNEIIWLQGKPGTNKTKRETNREYKNVGKALIDYVKYEYSDKPIEVQSANSAIEFYKKNGFKPLSKNSPCTLIYNV